MKNVIFMGTPDFAVGTLKALLDSRYTVQAVFTQPDKPKGRGKTLKMTPVKEVALEAGIPVYQPARIRDPENLEILKKYRPDVIVVVAFGQIIPEEILNYPPYGCINVHGSLLPKYRGAAPIQWAVIDGEEKSGITTMRMDAGLDTGDMLLKYEIPLAKDETGGSLFDKLSTAGAKLLLQTLEALEAGTVQPEKQPEESPTPYASMLKKQMGLIDWSQPASRIECLIRGLNPWPSAYTFYHGKTLKLWAAEVEESAAPEAPAGETSAKDAEAQAGETSAKDAEAQAGETSAKDAEVPAGEASAKDAEASDGETSAPDAKAPITALMSPGTVAEVTKRTLKIQTGNGLLSIKELQLEGKKRMETDAFLRGFPITPGERLGE